MRVLQVSSADIRGGAEKVAWNLFSACRARGHESWLAVGDKYTDDPDILLIPNQAERGAWYHFWRAIAGPLEQAVPGPLARLAGGIASPRRRLDYYLGVEDFHAPGTARLLSLPPRPPDIVHAHNLHGDYFDLRALPWLSQQSSLLLTLHDAWLLSGHCAHSFDCERWMTGCGQCPDLTIYPALRRDATAYNWRRKQSIYAQSSLYVATPSRWLMNKVERSMLAPAVREARVIPNGVDLEIFHPAGREAARASLDIPSSAAVLLTTGVKFQQNIWKDSATLREAVARVGEQHSEKEPIFVVLGQASPPEHIGGVEVRYAGYQSDPRVVARYYQAADIYLHASHADTFPIAVLEALACGAPVIATAVGGIPEQVEDGRTGFLVPPRDAGSLAARVSQLLSDRSRLESMGREAAESARRRFGLDQQIDAYLDWYRELVQSP
jgi:glycosyltransferase involved in cell wall biosynthesis